ncbi:preprotein translocase subunit SecE [Sphingomicrobium flavum]|uniref:preprotein translocase subunit SecE n=1 Tax=Sphingomicrobium flavum TaxID=1229164 RepID=UPI0021AD5908|nr:preprotein translocase subunit SecE [Sphingomicrobium flavum]
MAKTNPSQFIKEVRAETKKVVWPTRKETVTTAIMVLIMTTLLAAFFMLTDTAFGSLVRFLVDLIR